MRPIAAGIAVFVSLTALLVLITGLVASEPQLLGLQDGTNLCDQPLYRATHLYCSGRKGIGG